MAELRYFTHGENIKYTIYTPIHDIVTVSLASTFTVTRRLYNIESRKLFLHIYYRYKVTTRQHQTIIKCRLLFRIMMIGVSVPFVWRQCGVFIWRMSCQAFRFINNIFNHQTLHPHLLYRVYCLHVTSRTRYILGDCHTANTK